MLCLPHPDLKHGKSREDEREGGRHHEEAGHDGHNLGGERRVGVLEEVPKSFLKWEEQVTFDTVCPNRTRSNQISRAFPVVFRGNPRRRDRRSPPQASLLEVVA